MTHRVSLKIIVMRCKHMKRKPKRKAQQGRLEATIQPCTRKALERASGKLKMSISQLIDMLVSTAKL